MADGWRCSDAAGRPDAAHDDAGRVLRALTGRVVAQRLRRAIERGAARCRRVFRGGGAAGLPPLRRVSGDVVTAGPNYFRVSFGPVPGSP
ncbi:2-aminoethanethiol dioxygenase-like [Dorcoceras hygrometricum]|uniref:2-aminoethanethiol dioxygenase-like n=1 Tax=Dorcoceras hygrometricum TaxID=472368 RepID=A0A2Z6ZT54_9LAMI|nr:2-aminoethanethiol dioxygenase-like [Dorcoceras hygrometricum]